MILGGGTKIIENDTRLDSRAPVNRVEIQYSIHVSTHIENDGGVARLSRKTRPRAPSHDGNSVSSAYPQRLEDVGLVKWTNDTYGNLAIV